MKKNTILILILIVASLAMTRLVIVGVDKQEIVECQKWERQSQEFGRYDSKTQTGFYITNWQSEQCKAHRITIDAEVL